MEGYEYSAAVGNDRKNARAPIIKDNGNLGITPRTIKELFTKVDLAK
jgi:hypothetical protein